MDFSLLYSWIDLIWIPIAWFVIGKGKKIKGILFVLSCVFTLRLQVELMQEIGKPTGILPFLDFPVLERGYLTYGVAISLFLLLSHYSRKEDPFVYIAAAITVYIAAFCLSSFIMIL